MAGSGVRGFFQKAFPFISAGLSLGGPVGNAAAGILGKVIGKPDLTPDKVDEALEGITLTPELQVELQKAELSYKQQMNDAGFKTIEDLLAIDAADRADARQMQIKTGSNMPAVLAWAAVITMIACIGLLTFKNLPDTGHDAIMILLGAVTVTYKDVYGYFFGSSAGSAAKDTVIANQAAK